MIDDSEVGKINSDQKDKTYVVRKDPAAPDYGISDSTGFRIF